MENIYKIVDFTKCKECVRYNDPESSEKCNDCLTECAREYTNTPLYFEIDERNKKRNE